MRTVTFICDKCGKAIRSENATKLNINLQRGKDSVEKHLMISVHPVFWQ